MRRTSPAGFLLLAALLLCAAPPRFCPAASRGAKQALPDDASDYPWEKLETAIAEFKAAWKETRPLIKKLRGLQSRYANPEDIDGLVAERSAVHAAITLKLGTLHDIHSRFAQTRKAIHYRAIMRGIQLSLSKDRNANRSGTVMGKIMGYRTADREMNALTDEIYELLNEDKRNFEMVADSLAQRRKTGLLLKLVGGAIVILGVVFFIGFKGRAASIQKALPHETLPKLPAGASSAIPAAAPPASARPQVLGGNFKIEKEIGRGGMGVVYKAYDMVLGRHVAVKKMRKELLQSEKDLKKFLVEARLVASLKHPCLVEIYSILKEPERLYLIFEYVQGQTLYQLLAKKKKLPLKEARFILRQMAGALDYAHSKKVIHRDLKPSNVMITPGGEVKVMDFGIAHQAKSTVARLTRAEAWGTPPYMAPEQELGAVSRESDIFSLGVCFYEMLTGEPPFKGPDFLAAKREMRIRPPSELAAGSPRTLDAVIRKSLAAKTADRFHCCEEFVKAVAASSR